MGKPVFFIVEYDMSWRVAGTVINLKLMFADGNNVALIEPYVGTDVLIFPGHTEHFCLFFDASA